jgi:hypothetical protein
MGLSAVAVGQVTSPPSVAPAAPASGEGTGKQPETAGEGPKLVFERLVQDWGVVTDQDALKGEIKFKNTGKSTLIISEVKASCGCVRPKLRGEKKEYAAGEEGVLDIGFEPLNKQGGTKMYITVRTNDVASPLTNIDIKCDVKPTVGIESPEGMSFGTQDAGVGKTLTFHIFGVLPDFKATFATISAETGFDVKIGETVEAEHRGEKVRRTPVIVTMKENAAVSKFSHSVVIRHSDKRIKGGLWEATVTGEVLNDIRADKSEVDLGSIAIGEEFNTEVRLTHVKGKPFNVKAVRYVGARGGAVSVETTTEPTDKPDSVVVRLKGKAPSRPGAFEGRVQVAVDAKGMPAISIPFKILVRDRLKEQSGEGTSGTTK